MTGSNLDALQRDLELRKIRREGAALLKGQERYDFMSIQDKYDHARTETEALYRREYKIRVDVAYQMLMRKAAAHKPELKPPGFGVDRFNKGTLTRDAQRLVRMEHARTMARLDESELRESRKFMEKSSQRQAFAHAFKSSATQRQQTNGEGPTRGPSPSMSD